MRVTAVSGRFPLRRRNTLRRIGHGHPVEALVVKGVVGCLGPAPEDLGGVIVPAHKPLVIEVEDLLATVGVDLAGEADTDPLPVLAPSSQGSSSQSSNPGSTRTNGIVR
jgi:hypothetical protein